MKKAVFSFSDYLYLGSAIVRSGNLRLSDWQSCSCLHCYLSKSWKTELDENNGTLTDPAPDADEIMFIFL